MSQGILFHKKIQKKGDNKICGIKNVTWGNIRGVCCMHERNDSIGDCDAFNWPKGPAFDVMLKYAGDEKTFYTAFLLAWKRATENGFPRPLE